MSLDEWNAKYPVGTRVFYMRVDGREAEGVTGCEAGPCGIGMHYEYLRVVGFGIVSLSNVRPAEGAPPGTDSTPTRRTSIFGGHYL